MTWSPELKKIKLQWKCQKKKTQCRPYWEQIEEDKAAKCISKLRIIAMEGEISIWNSSLIEKYKPLSSTKMGQIRRKIEEKEIWKWVA